MIRNVITVRTKNKAVNAAEWELLKEEIEAEYTLHGKSKAGSREDKHS